MKFLFSLGLLFPLSWSASASQALLDCQGPKVKLEAWFMGKSEPEDIYVYDIDPTLGVPSQYSVSKFEWTKSNLNFHLISSHPEAPALEFRLQPDHVNGGYSGALHVLKGHQRFVYPHHRCDFR